MSRHSAHPPLETVLAADGTPLAARFHPPAGTVHETFEEAEAE